MMNAHPVLRLALALILWMAWPAGAATTDFSAAERAVFVDKHLHGLQPPLTLHYSFRKTGTLEPPFDDTVKLMLTAQPDGSCCTVRAELFTGARAVRQPDVESAQGNPAILYFLERDIHEMQRLTKGQPNYFRKRIRMALYQGASERKLTLPYRGRPVAVREISIAPYRDDPNHARFEKLTGKVYVFLLSDAVPGRLYGIRTRIDGESAAAPPLLAEEMLLNGTQP